MIKILERIIETKNAFILNDERRSIKCPLLYNLDDSTKGHKNNYWHSLQVCQNTLDHYQGNYLPEQIVISLFHDCAKPATKRFVKGNWTFHGHELLGAKMLDKEWNSLFGNAPIDKKMVLSIIENHGRPKELTEGKSVTDSAIRRIKTDMGAYFHELMFFAKMDMTTKDTAKIVRMRKAIDDIVARQAAIEASDAIANFQPALNGNMLMELGVFGSDISKVKNAIKLAILAGELENDVDACIAYFNLHLK